MADERDDIRARIDLVELVGQRVALKRAGRHFKGLCPFHTDKNPSFTVDPQTGRYRCWSCGESGDAFTWVMKTLNVDFPEALRELAERAGVTLTQRGPATPPSVREGQRSAMNESLKFFREQFAKNSHAREYCERRGLSTEALDRWEIGYAPDVGGALAVHLKKLGLSLAECKALFLVDEDSSGGYFDKFRGRLMFPIRDEKGDLVAFGGRLLGDGHPKYINSSDTPLYRKSRVLYGMNRAKDAMQKARRAVLVEGYLDVIACHRAEVDIALASLGTALSEDHAKLLKRWVEEVTVMYDSDDAGRKAADRAVDILQKEGLSVRVAMLPIGDDPDTLLRAQGAAAVKRAADSGVSPQEYRLQALEMRRRPEQPEFWSEAVDIFAESKGDLETSTNLNRLAAQYPGVKNVDEAIRVLKRLVSQRRKELVQNVGLPERRAANQIQMRVPLSAAELVIFQALFVEEFRRFAWLLIVNSERNDLFATNSATELVRAILEPFGTTPPTGPPSEWLAKIEPEETRRLLSDVMYDPRPQKLSEQVVMDTIEFLKRQAEQRQLRKLKQGNLTAEQRQEAFNRIRLLKPDLLIKQVGMEEDPLA